MMRRTKTMRSDLVGNILIDTCMFHCCFCCCVHFFVPRNAAVVRDPYEGNCECVGVESSKASEDSCHWERGGAERNKGHKS